MNKKGFTLVEVLAVIGVLALLLIIAVPKVNSYIETKRKDTFITNLRNISRQIEYDNLDFKHFTKTTLQDLSITNISNENFNLETSIAYVENDEIYIDLVGKGKYEGMYICHANNDIKDITIQTTPCGTSIEDLEYILFDVNLDGGHTTQEFNEKYIVGNYLILYPPKKNNYTFKNWELVSGNSIISGSRIEFGTENTSIKVVWVKNPTLTIDLDGGTTQKNQEGIYTGSTIIELKTPSKENYTFKGWKLVSGNSIISGNTLIIGNTDTTIKALWELNAFNLSIDLNGGSVSENQEGLYIVGETIELIQPTKEGYTFSHWELVSGLESGNSILSDSTFTMGTKAVDIKAVYTKNIYQINYELNGGTLGENSPTEGEYRSTIELVNPTRVGYIFVGWAASEGVLLSGNQLTIGTNNVTLTAKWEKANPLVSYSCANATVGEEPYLFTYTSDCNVIDDGNGNWRMKFLKSGTFTSTTEMMIDAFLVGGGGGGGYGNTSNSTYGGGGGGGYTTTQKGITIKSGDPYEITVGNGGAAGNAGESTIAFTITANGGKPGGANSGGAGGSGGGGMMGGGASNGASASGKGQGTTTKEFGETSGTLYAGGGGGGAGSGGSGGGGNGAGNKQNDPGDNGGTNTGGGGGGGTTYANSTAGGKGGSGIVVIRNSSSGCAYGDYPELEQQFTYTGNCQVINDGEDNWRIKFLTSGTFTTTTEMVVDAFLVGGGGGGGYGNTSNSTYGGGGGGGYTTTQKGITITSGEPYEIIVGNGGAAGTDGESTTAFNIVANGGKPGLVRNGGAGGSGGGGSYYLFKGGSDGNDGGGNNAYIGGSGQGTTTREFGETSGALYAGGGGGGSGTGGSGGGGNGACDCQNDPGDNGGANTGGGGGGGTTYANSTSGGKGGSGIVIIRKKK